MKMDRAYINYDEGLACCCWNAPSEEDLRQLFMKAGAPFDRILEVEEMTSA
ncbi:MAG: DUF4242 domain-containing protein [Candidatus Fermentibacteraceae bacterium]|nr:DUF4242 domain-containing protein [Candidatus Fermentibacteraceae bacterium]